MRQTRSGISLIEMLIAIAMIAVLIGLIVPGMVRTREAASRLQCMNHLKQIALAFHAHHQAHGFFATGGWNWSDPPTFDADGIPLIGAAQRAGWGFQILPYLEAQLTWAGGDGTNNQERVLHALQTPQPVYFCPSRRAPQVYAYCPPRSSTDPLAANIYALQPTSRPPILTAQCDYLASNYNTAPNGVVRRKFPIKIMSILDGVSQTMLAGEKRMNLRTMGSVGVNNDQGYADGWDGDTVGRTDLQPGPDLNDNTLLTRQTFGSSHATGFNIAFVDGSSRRISYSIAVRMFTALGDIADGTVVDLSKE